MMRMTKSKTCSNCLLQLPVENFHLDKRTLTGRYDMCRACRSLHRRASTISKQQYEVMLRQQDYSCAICGIPGEEMNKTFQVDHDHATQEIRGLLCVRCNIGLGYFMDSITNLNAAINYLMKTI